MDTKIRFNSITQKEDKAGNDFFIVKFDCIADEFEDAVAVKDFLETKLGNILNGQTTLKD